MSCCMAKFEWHIAWRYLFSKKGHNAINIVTCISAVAVAVVTAAMICVLSGLNGMGNLAEQMFSAIDPPLMVLPSEGQTLRTDTAPIVSLYAREDIACISRQIEQTAIVRYEDQQTPAHVLGVDSLFLQTTNLDSLIYDGYFSVYDGAHERAVVGSDIAEVFHLYSHSIKALHIYAPKRTKRINLARPDQSLLEEKAFTAGIFSGDQNGTTNQTLIVSIELAQRLYEYDDHTATALRIVPEEGIEISRLKSQISRLLGDDYQVLDRRDQQAEYFRIFRMEKWLTILLLGFISLIAVINIIGSLSMLIIDKKDDSRILSHMGADEASIRRIFRLEGWFISALGTFFGLIIGLVLCLGQQHFGWLELGDGSSYIVSAYPVEVQAADIVLVAVLVLGLGFLAAWYPTRKVKGEQYEA